MVFIGKYRLAVNAAAFILFAADKWKAVHKKWRIREFTLLGLAFAGGSAGGLLAMHVFRHKTQKTAFKIGMPLMLAGHAALMIYVFWYFN